MSRFYYFASDSILEEQPNPFVRLLSVNQALKMGVEADLDMFGEDFDKDKPNVILFCEDETQMEYPNIFQSINTIFMMILELRNNIALRWNGITQMQQ